MRTAKVFGTQADNLNHAALGIASEIFELVVAINRDDEPNVREEAGDVLWYVALACDTLGIQFADLAEMSKADDPDLFVASAASFVSDVKRVWVYGKDIGPLAIRMEEALLRIIRGIVDIIAEGGQALEDVLTANIAKLQARYPDKYSDYHAEARADKGGKDCAVS
jgi:NTP pyrophosphatase (non-canonical NTP hydrolase)